MISMFFRVFVIYMLHILSALYRSNSCYLIRKQQQLERGEYSASLIDSREPFDLQLGAYKNEELGFGLCTS